MKEQFSMTIVLFVNEAIRNLDAYIIGPISPFILTNEEFYINIDED
jgi:hypothetical protein